MHALATAPGGGWVITRAFMAHTPRRPASSRVPHGSSCGPCGERERVGNRIGVSRRHFLKQLFQSFGNQYRLRVGPLMDAENAEDVPWYVSVFVSWLPFILMMLFWIGIGRSLGKRIEMSLRAPDSRPVGQVIDDHAREMRRTNDMLEQMPKSHGARLEALEKNSHGRRRVVPTSTPAHAPAELRANGVQNMIRFHGNGSCSGRSIRNRLLIHR
jgi:hypothetical protein